MSMRGSTCLFTHIECPSHCHTVGGACMSQVNAARHFLQWR